MDESQIVQYRKKICLIGAFAVGKTSLVERFVYNRFSREYLTTVGVRVSQKLMPPVGRIPGKMVQYEFLIWDIAGIEKFDAMTLTYFRGSSGALAVTDVTRVETATLLDDMIKKFREVAPEAILVFAANKIDLTPSEECLTRLKELALQYDSPYLTTSALNGKNVEAAFLELAKQIELHEHRTH